MKFIILMILSSLAAGLISMLLGLESGDGKKEVEYFITAKNGAIGCLSKAAFIEEQGYYMSGDYKSAQKLLDDQVCFFFDKGTKIFAAEGTCSAEHKDDELFPFKPNDFKVLQPYLPCVAVR